MSQYFSVVPAVYILFRRNNHILMIRRANTGYHDGEYSFPAGHIDGGESAKQAAVREVKEELDLVIDEDKLRFVHVRHRIVEEGDYERVDFYFELTQWDGEPRNAEPHKCDDIGWFSMAELPKTTAPMARDVLASIVTGESYTDENFISKS